MLFQSQQQRKHKVQSNKNSTFEKNQVIDNKPENLFRRPKHCVNFLWAPAGSTQTSHSGQSGLDVDSKYTQHRTRAATRHLCSYRGQSASSYHICSSSNVNQYILPQEGNISGPYLIKAEVKYAPHIFLLNMVSGVLS